MGRQEVRLTVMDPSSPTTRSGARPGWDNSPLETANSPRVIHVHRTERLPMPTPTLQRPDPARREEAVSRPAEATNRPRPVEAFAVVDLPPEPSHELSQLAMVAVAGMAFGAMVGWWAVL